MSTNFSSIHLKPVDLSFSGRPLLAEDEYITFIKNDIGLYQDEYKIKNFQSGRVYLTNKRIIFVNNTYTNKNISIQLNHIDKAELSNGFLKSSPKVVIHLLGFIDQKSETSKKNTITTTWVCPICTYLNEYQTTGENLETKKYSPDLLPICSNCGVKTNYDSIENSINKNLAGRKKSIDLISSDGIECHKCTFVNHPSLINCEVCGASLQHSSNVDLYLSTQNKNKKSDLQFETLEIYGKLNIDIIKLSFRNGGNKDFYLNLVEMLNSKEAIKDLSVFPKKNENIMLNGIHGLQNVSLQENHDDTLLLGKSVQDLDQLLSKANELITLSKKFQNILIRQKVNEQEIDANFEFWINSKKSVSKLNVLMTDNQIGKSITAHKNINALNTLKLENGTNDNVSHFSKTYIDELARCLYEFLIDENILDKNLGLITINDLYLLYNKSRQIDLVAPEEIWDSVQRFEHLGFNIQVTQILLHDKQQIQTSKKKQTHVYTLSKKNQNYSKKVFDFICSNPGLTTEQLQINLRVNNFILKHILNSLIDESKIVIDLTVRGCTYWENQILYPKSNLLEKGTKLIENKPEDYSKNAPIFPSYIYDNDIASKRFEDLQDLKFA